MVVTTDHNTDTTWARVGIRYSRFAFQYHYPFVDVDDVDVHKNSKNQKRTE